MAQHGDDNTARDATRRFNVGYFHLGVSIANEIARMVANLVNGDMEAPCRDWKYYFLADHSLHRRWEETDAFGQHQLGRLYLVDDDGNMAPLNVGYIDSIVGNQSEPSVLLHGYH